MVKACFLDRDGIINNLIDRGHQKTAPWHISEFELKENIYEYVNILKELGFLVFVISNQPDVAAGKLKYKHLELMNAIVLKWIKVDEVLIALERNTEYYKPNNGLVLEALEKYNINETSYMIGDTWKDIVCGNMSNLITVYVNTEPYSAPEQFISIKPDYWVNNLKQVVELIGFMENDKVIL